MSTVSDIPQFAMFYVVFWPERGIAKIGRCWKFSRVRKFLEAGARPIILMRDVPLWWEDYALREVRSSGFERAFASWSDSWDLLPNGRGFTECFNVSDLEAFIEVVFQGIRKGVVANDYVEGSSVAAGGVSRRDGFDASAGGEVDSVRAVGVRGRSWSPIGEYVSDQVDVVSGKSVGYGCDDRGASFVVGRCGSDSVVCGWKEDVVPVLSLAAVSVCGQAETFGVSGAGFGSRGGSAWFPRGLRGGSANHRGCGERGRVGGSWGGCRGGVLGRAAPRCSRVGCVSCSGLQGSSEWYSGQLPGLWYRTASSSGLGEGAGRFAASFHDLAWRFVLDLVVTRAVLADLQAWQDVVADAKGAYKFKSFAESSAWLQSVPRFLPKRQRVQWLLREKELAFSGVRPKLLLVEVEILPSLEEFTERMMSFGEKYLEVSDVDCD